MTFGNVRSDVKGVLECTADTCTRKNETPVGDLQPDLKTTMNSNNVHHT